MKKAFMITGGEIDVEQLRSTYIQDAYDYVVGVDGGCKKALEAGIKLNLIYGDFDTLEAEIKQRLEEDKIPIIQLSVDKNMTDTHGALLELVKLGMESVLVFGSVGTRMDHTLGNMFVPFSIIRHMKVTCVDSHNKIEYHTGPCNIEIPRSNYTYLSIVPIEETFVTSTSGLKYNVEKQVFSPFESLGISNEQIENTIIKVDYGKFILIQSKD